MLFRDNQAEIYLRLIPRTGVREVVQPSIGGSSDRAGIVWIRKKVAAWRGQRSPRIPKALATIVHQVGEGKRPQPVWIETVKMYCFCTADLPIRAILAISEDVITAMGKRRSS